MESLQQKHREESLQQQRVHLAQLRQLQGILLNELATQCSGASELDEEVKAELLQSFGLNQTVEEELNDSSAQTPLHDSSTDEQDSDTTQSLRSTPDKPAASNHPPYSSLSTASTEYLELPAGGHTPFCSPTVKLPLSSSPNKCDSLHLATPPEVSNNCNDSRSALMEKHAKHIEDLQAYYETQLSDLQEKLTTLQLRTAREQPAAVEVSPRGRLSYSPSRVHRHNKPKQRERMGRDHQLVMRENHLLKEKCAGLEQEIEDYRKSHRSLQQRTRHLEQQQVKRDFTKQQTAHLQSKLSSATSQLKEQSELISELHSEIDSLSSELEQLGNDKDELKEVLDQVYNELEPLQDKYQRSKMKNKYLEDQLAESHSEIAYLKATIDQQQSVIKEHMNYHQELETKIQRLSHANNRLHSQTTHFEFGTPNVPDEGKLDSPTTTPTYHRSPHHQLSPNSTHHYYSRPTSSNPSSASPHHRSSRLSSDYHPSGNKKLTRQRWMESSGIAYGSPYHSKDYTSFVDDYNRKSPDDQQLASEVSPSSTEKYRDTRGPSLTVEERVEQRLQAMSEAEKKLEQLQKEKERLESIVQKVTPPGYKAKLQRREADERLEEVLKEMGSVRMTLRLSSSWKK